MNMIPEIARIMAELAENGFAKISDPSFIPLKHNFKEIRDAANEEEVCVRFYQKNGETYVKLRKIGLGH